MSRPGALLFCILLLASLISSMVKVNGESSFLALSGFLTGKSRLFKKEVISIVLDEASDLYKDE